MAVNIRETSGFYQTIPIVPAVNLTSGQLFVYGTTNILCVAEKTYYAIDVLGNVNTEGVTAAVECVVEIGQTAAQTALALGAQVKFNFTTQLIDSTAAGVIGTVIAYNTINNNYTVKLFAYLNGVPTVA